MKYDNYIGFYTSLFIQTYMGMGFLVLFSMLTQLQIGFSSYMHTCAADIKQIFYDLDKYKRNVRHRQDINSKSLIKDAIQLHVDILRYFIRFFFPRNIIIINNWISKYIRIMDNLREMLDGTLFFQLIVFVTFSAFLFLAINQNGFSLNFSFVFCFNSVLTQFALNFVSCFYGSKISDRFSDMGNDVYLCEWYCWSIDEQRSARRIIERTQTPYFLTGFKYFTCTMGTFLTVRVSSIFAEFAIGNFYLLWIFLQLTRAAVSYFLIARQFSK